MPHRKPMVNEYHPHDAVYASVVNEKVNTLIHMVSKHPIVCYPARYEGRRVMVLGVPLEDGGAKPLALILSDRDMGRVDITETQEIEGLIIDDTRVN